MKANMDVILSNTKSIDERVSKLQAKIGSA